MTECIEKTTPQPSVASRPAVPRKKRTQEKVMAILTLFFIGGVVLYSVLPEGPVRGSSIGAFSLLMTYMLYRLGI